jgi:hypothetical protein
MTIVVKYQLFGRVRMFMRVDKPKPHVYLVTCELDVMHDRRRQERELVRRRNLKYYPITPFCVRLAQIWGRARPTAENGIGDKAPRDMTGSSYAGRP